MSINWVADIAEMHRKYGVKEAVANFDKEKFQKFLEFRINFLQEELDELKAAQNADDVVDALIDLCVVAIGTLDAYNVNSYLAWDRVHAANMTKEVGIKASRPNKLGLPDLIKPTMETHGYDWEAPTHEDNTGLFKALFEQPQTEEVQVEAVPEATTEEGEAAPKRKTRSKKV
jgi:predicted HAD superfamily Cof-like phosphohydrolase